MTSLGVLVLALLAFVTKVSGNAVILARPPFGKRAGGPRKTLQVPVSGNGVGFITSDNPVTHRVEEKASPPSFVSLGIRSSCARKKATMLDTSRAASAVSRLRGGIQAFPTKGMDLSLLIHQPVDGGAKDTVDATARLHKCGGNSASDAQMVSAKSQIAEDTRAYDVADSYDEDLDDQMYGSGGGSGGRAGTLPSSSRNLPSGRAAFNKKFAWVP